MSARWICCHLGAREHYAVPRALHRRGELSTMIVDAWAAPGSAWTAIPGEAGRRLAERYSPDLADGDVRDCTASLVAHETSWRLQGIDGWDLFIARNWWFQERCARQLAQVQLDRAIVFAHSYIALDTFRAAHQRGWMCVLGQIDPGAAHQQIVNDVAVRWPEFGPPLSAPPARYFDDWREECRLADRIVVNSEWSRDCLERDGVEPSKIHVIALPYEGEPVAWERDYPAAFTNERPLRVLFVGSIAAFKGVPSLLESLDRLGDLPIEMRLVGPLAATIPDRFAHDHRVMIVGAVTRSEVAREYRDADVLVFPSHSDGFGMAQVEAAAWRLPIIASRSCGRVVDHGVNGVLLREVSASSIADALLQVARPGVLRAYADAPRAPKFTLDAFGEALSAVATVAAAR